MCVIVNLDLVVPAVISREFISIKSLNGNQNNLNAYLSTMTISADQVMNYAMRMRAWDLGRVVVNFEREDVDRYLKANVDIFEQVHQNSVYAIKFPESVKSDLAGYVSLLIGELTSRINYPPRVLRTVGLSREDSVLI